MQSLTLQARMRYIKKRGRGGGKRIKKTRVIFPKHSLVVRHREFLKQLHQAAKEGSKNKINQLINQATNSQLNSFSELSRNLIQGNYPNLSRRFVRFILPLKSLVRKFGKSSLKLRDKKNLLLSRTNQTGGFGFLIPLLAPLLGSVLGSVVSAVTK